MLKTRHLILGAGPAGLGAALRLQEAGVDWLICEREAEPGGLSASFVDERGFTWDYGGHVLFSHYETFDKRINAARPHAGAWLDHRRESWIWQGDRFIPYPFQYNLHRLPPEGAAACLRGVEEALRVRHDTPPANFRELLLRSFGLPICEHFMFPYNDKVWAWPLDEMDCDWIGERVAMPDIARIRAGFEQRRDDKSWGPNNAFRFPDRGGTGAIWKALADGLPPERLRFRAEAVAVDASARTIRLRGGDVIGYDACISTIPLDQLAALADDPALTPRIPLRASATRVIGIGLAGTPPPDIRTKCWMYFPCANSPHYRVTVFSNYSPSHVPGPGPQWSLMAEVSESPVKRVDADGLVQTCVNALVEDGLIPDPAQIVSTTMRRVPYGYPTPFLGRKACVAELLAALEARSLYSRGRFGAWTYEAGNMDHAFMQGYECVGRLLNGGGPECEPTLNTPHVVNSRYNPESEAFHAPAKP